MKKSARNLKSVRRKLGFSMRDVADCLDKMPKSTYQRYEDGSAAIPDEVWQRVLDLKRSVDGFMAGIPARVDKALEKEYTKGLILY